MKHIKTFTEFLNESKVNEETYKMSQNDFRARISELKDDYMEDFWSPSITTMLSKIINKDNSVKSDIHNRISKIESKLKKKNVSNEEILLYKMQITFLKKVGNLKSNNIDFEKIADELESIAQQKESLRPEDE